MSTAEVALVTYSTRPRGGVVHTLALAEALTAAGVVVHNGVDVARCAPLPPSRRVQLRSRVGAADRFLFALADALHTAATDREVRRTLVEGGRQVAARYSRPACAEEHRSVYERLGHVWSAV